MNRLAHWIGIYEERSLRERVLIGLTLLATIWGLWIVSVGGYVIDTRVNVEKNVHRLATELQSQAEALQRVSQSPEKLRLRDLLRQKDQLELDVAKHTQQLDILLDNFIEPKEVPGLLREILHRQQGVELKALRNLPPKQILVGGEQSGLYRHPLQVELAGGYRDVVEYLSALETIPKGLHWRAINYQVDTYPNAKVVLELETLSRHRAWLGV